MKSSWWQPAGKRIADVIGALVALIIAFPAMVVIAAAIKLTSNGPIFFRQERSGINGTLFSVFKFRTMTVDTAVEVGRETLSSDPRITFIGRWLRRVGLDELPQLLNVLAGEMSLVGPRPLLKWENDRCDGRQSRRLLVKPGLTGLSQVNGRNSIPWDDRVEWDVQYVERVSAGLDLLVLLKTVRVVFRGENAYRDQRPAVGIEPSVILDALAE